MRARARRFPRMTGFVPEDALIPYRASTFSARRVLVLSPHPDDEVFGCGAALAALRSSGAGLDVLVLTDGAGDHPDPAARRRVQEVRLAESWEALVRLGGGSLRCAGLRDRGLGVLREPLRAAVAEALAGSRPELVFCPSPVEIHPDHRATAAALVAVAEEAGPGAAARVLSEAKVAFFELSQPIRPNFLFDCGDWMQRKRRAMEAFPSQMAERDYAAFVEGLNAYRRMTLPRETSAAEAYFVVEGRELSRGLLHLSEAMGPWIGEDPP